MAKRFKLLVLPLILIAAVLAGISSLPATHAAGFPGPGTVCLTDASDVPAAPASPCPATPFVFNAPFPSTPQPGPTQIRVGVYVNGSSGLNAIDVTLLANHATLAPVAIDLTGTLLTGPSGPAVTVLLCIGGKLISGTVCSGTDTLDTIHIAATEAVGASLTTAPTTGLLFTAIYNVTGTTPATGVPIGFQTGCSGTSTSDGVTCITIANGSKVPNPEVAQGASFNNSANDVAWFAETANVTATNTLLGSSSGNHVLLSSTVENGGPPVLGGTSVIFTAAVTAGFGAVNFNGNPSATCTPAVGAPCSVVATLSTSTPGSYSATFYETYTGDDCGTGGPCSTTFTLIGTLTVTVSVQDVAWTVVGVPFASTQTMYFAKGPFHIPFTFQSLGGYSGTLTLAISTCNPGTTGAVCGAVGSTVASFSLAADQTITRQINFTAANYGRILYRDTLTATSLAVKTQGTDTIFVSGFSMASNSTGLTFPAGGSGHILVTLTSLGAGSTMDFTGAVAIGSTVSPTTGLAVSCAPVSATLAAAGTATTTCTLGSPTSTPNTYSVSITGTGGTNNEVTNATAPITVAVQSLGPPPGINLNASPTSVAANVGAPGGTSTVTVASRGGFTGVVALTVAATNGASCTMAPNSVTLGASVTSTLTCTNTAAVTSVATVTATSGAQTNSTSVTFAFRDFTIAASSPAAVNVGTSSSSTITVTAVNGFTGTVSLTDTVPSGLTCGAVAPTSVAGSGTATVSCSSTTAGTFTLTVTGTIGSLTHSATATFNFVDFTIVASSPASVSAGTSATSTITVAALNGFAGTVSLTDAVPSGLTCGAITPTGVTGSGSATVSCSSTGAGTFTLTITGTSGSLSHSATATFTFTAPQDFTISASSPAPTNAGSSASSTITVTSVGGFAGIVSLTDTVPAGLTCSAITPGSVTGSGTATVSCSSTTAGTFTLSMTGTSTSPSITHSTTATFNFVDFTIAASSPAAVNAGQSATSTITITAVNGFAGVVSLTGTVPAGLTCGAITPTSVTGSGTATLSCSASAAGTFVLTLTGTSGSLSHAATATFNFRDFTIAATSPAAVNAGQSATSTITIAAVNSFAGVVSLTDTVPAGLTCAAITSTSITGSGSATVSCSSTAAGTFTLAVTGSSGSLTHSTSATFNFVDFTIAASSPAAVSNGASATSSITISALNGFSGTVDLTDTVPAGLTCGTITPSSVTGSGTATVSCSSTTASTFSLTVTGTSGSLTHSATASFNFQDFTISATSPASVPAGSSASSTITVTAVNGFTGVVDLTDTVPAGLTCGAITPSSVTGSGTATLSCSSPTANVFSVTVTGTSGSLTHSATATFTFGAPPDFTIAATSPTTTNAGASASSTITITASNGFSGTVTLTDTVPTGLTCGAITPSSVTGSGSATVSCSSAAAGTFTLSITGTSATPAITHSTTATFNFVDFTVAATSPSTTTGSSATSTITIAVLNGFAGTVSLADTVPAGLTCGAIAPASISGAGTATLACSSTTANTFTVTITGTSGSLSHSATATFVFTAAADFSISATSPAAVTVGTTATSTITVTGLNGFSGTVTLTDTVPAGLTCTGITPGSITGSGTATLSCASTIANTFTVTVTGTSTGLVHSASATFTFNAAPDFTISASSPASVNTGGSASSTITIAALNGFAGVVTLTDTPPAGLTCGAITPGTVTGSGTATVTCSATVAATYVLSVTGTSGSLVHTASATFTFTAAQDFTIAASSPAAVNAGQSATSTITVTALNGFTGVVVLTDTAPAGLTCGAITPGSITVSGTATVSCSATVAGTYILTITSTAGSIVHSATATFNFVDFTISATSPSSVTVGASATSTITITAVNGFAGTVGLTDTIPAGLTCNPLTPTSISSAGTATLACTSTIANTYTVTVTGTSGSLSHSASATFAFANAADFSISATSPSAVNTGVSSTSTIAISALNGFSGLVSLTDTVPAGLTCGAITPSSVTGSGTATLSCTSASPGSLSVTVTGTSGSLVHSATATFMFTAVADFTISASSPSAVTVGQFVNSTITITAVNGFSGVVTLTDTVPASLVCDVIIPNSVTGSGTATIACSATVPATYKLTVTGTSGSLTHSAIATFTFNAAPDFAIATNPTSVNIISGTNGTSTVTVSALNGFTGTVNLNATVSPSSGLKCGLSLTTISGGSGTSALFCNGTTGVYTVTVRGTSGALSHSATVTFNVSPSTGAPVLLTFQGFDIDDFENGLGQLQVSVNGHLVVDLPSGLNHLNGTGDYAPYDNKWINFGPFDITSFIVQGQNTILFRDPQTSDHFGLVKNVTIVQGNTLLLHVERARGVYPEFSFTYTFSIPPLVITSFVASTTTAVVEQVVTFTATYTGGTAPFVCIFSFGDFHFGFAAGVNGMCSVTHDYDFNGTFHALVIIKGASTSDLQTAKLNITVTGNASPENELSTATVALATVETN